VITSERQVGTFVSLYFAWGNKEENRGRRYRDVPPGPTGRDRRPNPAARKSLVSRLTSHREAEKVTVAVESPSGPKIETTCGSADDAEQLFRTLREVFDKDA
jgi:hypothetical protein